MAKSATYFAVLILLSVVACAYSAEKELPAVKLGPVRREPVAAIFWNDKLAAIACAKSGTLIFWNVDRGEIEQEFQVGKQLRGVARWQDDQLLAIDEKANQLVQLRYSDGKLWELARQSVPDYPVSLISWSDRGEWQATIASLWSRKVTVWKQSMGAVTLQDEFDLPSEPRAAIPTPYLPFRGALAVIPAFGGEALLVKRDSTAEPPQNIDHQIGAMAFKNKLMLGTRQKLNQVLPLTEANVAGGNVMQNELLSNWEKFPLTREDTQGNIYNDQNADPAGIAITTEGILVCLAGADQVWYRHSLNEKHPQRLPVGKRPRTVIVNGSVGLVLGELDDSVSRIDFKNPARLTVSTELLDPALANRELSPAERGERLFFSGKMSAGGMMSCHSCHTDGHTNGLLADTLGDNTHGTPKRVLTLRGTRLTDLWSWNGEMKTLQDNVHKSLRETMHAPEIKPADVDDLVSFLHSLPPVPPLKPATHDPADRASVARGEKVFQRENCGNCHVPPLTFTSHGVFDVGLADEKGLKKFNPPSLRGVGRLPRLFHDNRASSMRDVFEIYGHQLATPLPEGDLTDLIRYLQSL